MASFKYIGEHYYTGGDEVNATLITTAKDIMIVVVS